MKGFLVTLVLGAPIIAALLFFALQDKEEVKQEQAVERIEQKIEAAKFDRDFANAWNSGGRISAPTDDDLAGLEAERAKLLGKQERISVEAESDVADLRAALKQMGEKK